MNINFNQVLSAMLLTAMASFQTPAISETMCKGLSENNCAVDSACTWVSSYVTKNGTEVNGYCRVKPGKRSTTKTSGSADQLKKDS